MTDARREEVIKKFLAYSFVEVREWDGLTDSEQEICTEEEWLELRAWCEPEVSRRVAMLSGPGMNSLEA